MRILHMCVGAFTMTLFLGGLNLSTFMIVNGAMAFITLLNVLLDINEKLDKVNDGRH